MSFSVIRDQADKRKQEQIDKSHIPKGAVVKEISQVVPKLKGTGSQVVTARVYANDRRVPISEMVRQGVLKSKDPRRWE